MTSLTTKMKKKKHLENERTVQAGSLPWQVAVPSLQEGQHLLTRCNRHCTGHLFFGVGGTLWEKATLRTSSTKSTMSNKKCNEHLPLTAPLFGHFFILFSRSNLFVQRWTKRQLRLRAAAAASLWWSRKLSQFYFFVTTIHTVTVLVLFHELLQYFFLCIPSFCLAISLRKRLAESRRVSRLLVPKNAMSLHAELELSTLDEDALVKSTEVSPCGGTLVYNSSMKVLPAFRPRLSKSRSEAFIITREASEETADQDDSENAATVCECQTIASRTPTEWL